MARLPDMPLSLNIFSKQYLILRDSHELELVCFCHVMEKTVTTGSQGINIETGFANKKKKKKTCFNMTYF